MLIKGTETNLKEKMFYLGEMCKAGEETCRNATDTGLAPAVREVH